MCSNLREELDWVESMDNIIVISVLSDAVDRLIVKLLKRVTLSSHLRESRRINFPRGITLIILY